MRGEERKEGLLICADCEYEISPVDDDHDMSEAAAG